jgi:hypothetical protein
MSMVQPVDGRAIASLNGRRLLLLAVVAMIGLASSGALAVYLLSLHIASANRDARTLDAQLVTKRHEVRQLRQELDIRSRFVELERWGPTLGLRPAGSGQYAPDMRQLGAIAAARRQQIASAEAAPCGTLAPGPCPPVGGRRGYTPEARKALDSLIGDVLN